MGGGTEKRWMLMILQEVPLERERVKSVGASSHPFLPPLPSNLLTATQLQRLLIDFKCN